MSLASGARLGPYEILSPLGAGGMGEVYRARDSKLNREVALKILPESFATDPDRLARFRREAQVLASLNHPQIGHIYGFEDGESHALVLELIEGETLAERLSRGPLPPAEALPIARQIAAALEAAHEHGIVHRDLKPANIKIKPDGSVKVLDFGLAKALVTAAHAGRGSDDSPTLTALATEMGVVLGTAAYMAPEQAQGKPADRRADIWAFGAVLYEMLSGRRAFEGEGRADTLAAVLRQEVDWTALPDDTPAHVRGLLARCLDRDATRRLRDIGEARISLEQPASAEIDARLAEPQRSLWRRAIPVALGAMAGGVLIGTAWYLSLDRAAPLPVTRLTINLPEGQVFTGLSGRALAVSPDGTLIAYVANGQLHLRALSDADSKPIQGTEGFQAVAEPVFSPDSRSLVFHAVYDQTLKRIAVTGGAAVTIAKADIPFGVHWGLDGIVYGQRGGIWRVSPTGGTPELIVKVNDGETAHGPQVLAGGPHVLFTLATGASPDRWNTAQIVVQSLATGERKTVIAGGSDARYVTTGHLVYALEGTVLAAAFDLQRLEVIGNPVPIVEGVRRAISGGGANFFVSDFGTLTYVRGPARSAGLNDLALVDRTGRVQPLKLPPGAYTTPRVSPDGRRIAFGAEEGSESRVWIYDLSEASAMRRLTFGGNNRFPLWSSDGTRVAFQSDREGDLAIFWQPADGGGIAERLTTPESGTSHEPESWSPDGKVLLYSVTKDSDISLWMLSMRERTSRPFGAVHSVARTNAVFSPDGRWVAYTSTDQGNAKVYIQPFPPTGVGHQLTSELASQPLWTPDGKELIYNPRPGLLAITGVSTTPTVAFSAPVEFARPVQTGPPAVRRAYDITPSGRFLGLITAGQTDSDTREMNSQIQVVLNWVAELKQRVPLAKP